MRSNSIIVLLLAAMVAGCSGAGSAPAPEPPSPAPNGESTAMAFVPGAADQSSTSRTDTPMQSVFTTFGVYAWKVMPVTAERQWVVKPYTVQWDTTNELWYYDGIGTQTLRYWDFSAAHYTFVAYAPAGSTYDSHVTLSDETNGHLTITGITGHTDPTATTDWLMARHLRERGATPAEATDTDELDALFTATHPAMDDAVPLRFHHLMAKVDYRLYRADDHSYRVKSVTVVMDNHELATSATYDSGADDAAAWNDSWLNWTDYTGAATQMASYSNDSDDSNEWLAITGSTTGTAHQIDSRLEIPQSFGGTAYDPTMVEIEIVAVDETNTEHTLKGSFPLTGGWATNTHYIYYIGLSQSPILVTLELGEFEEAPDEPLADVEHGW